ncbi:uncharacterized protein PHALS_09772 [Plasmopara halstedii]|uniref:Uncharacterized protein n=1 Tax=Plasmopara halstedii TaxID=4781 RepID=A0A0P1AGE2_PLAHL|nr:uncharacterized protein PHALS_09772 [Plasmopara halstedii]CEG39530.1 hypothetical protein PHALS_09772 [Plasmopara halstedii]|eukprot:XP_024575899.1 hypothetical protein PHALS_09772 [Plasmopara halstedii]
MRTSCKSASTGSLKQRGISPLCISSYCFKLMTKRKAKFFQGSKCQMKSHIGNVCLRLLQITRRLEVVFVAISAKTLTHDSSRTRLSAFQSQTSFAKACDRIKERELNAADEFPSNLMHLMTPKTRS